MFNIKPDDKLYLLLWALGSRIFILFALIRFLIVNDLTVLEWACVHVCLCVHTCACVAGLTELLTEITHTSFSL